MKRTVIFLVAIALALRVNAQPGITTDGDTQTSNLKSQTSNLEPQTSNIVFQISNLIGYLSYDSVLVTMPGYALAQQQLSELRAQYEAEQQRVEQDFNQKYEEFLDGQREFPPTILRKRQTELKELMERNVAFKAEVRRELQKAEAEALAPLKAHLKEVIAEVAKEQELAVVLNTDNNACPYIDPELSIDITKIVADRLALEKVPRLIRSTK